MAATAQSSSLGKYRPPIVLIHWTTAILILVQFPLGEYMEDKSPADILNLIQIHAVLGLAIFTLSIIRTYYHFTTPQPPPIKTGSEWNDKLIVWNHNAIYFLLFAVSISGIVLLNVGGYVDAIKSGDATLIETGEPPALKAHGLMIALLMINLVVHIVGVIRYYLKTDRNILNRMSL